LAVRVFLLGLLIAAVPVPVHAQFKAPVTNKGARLDRQVTQRIRIGVVVKAAGTLQNVVATVPAPGDWPEQQVTIVHQDITPSYARVDFRNVVGGGGVKQMVIGIPRLAAGREARALVTFEVTRHALAAPADTALYTIPKKLNNDLRINLGASPYIESRHPKIVSAAKQATAQKLGAWEKTEAIYDWVRDNVKYKDSELKGAARALYDQEGGADELTSLFVAMCRAQKIPARTVFVYGHCYAEFYLADDEAQGHWFPCQPAGVRSFGAIDDLNPILQKGDNFRNPENRKERLRFVTEYFNAAGRGKAPHVRFVSELVSD
jgi:transglutaminase-like putative cysteine protease